MVCIGVDVSTVWRIGPINMVGVLMGYHGTSYLFRYLWNCNGRIRLLLFNQSGEYFNRIFIWIRFVFDAYTLRKQHQNNNQNRFNGTNVIIFMGKEQIKVIDMYRTHISTYLSQN